MHNEKWKTFSLKLNEKAVHKQCTLKSGTFNFRQLNEIY